ncbi:hypothetical protein HF895_01340 [Bacteroides sp. AN502]|nr:hypothetical protein [Caecibacteroides pullorum]MDC6279616.1 hypothetical protein [Caecibacteroides pullorum]
MKKGIIYTVVILIGMLATLGACRQNEWQDESLPAAKEGYLALRFTADIPDMQEVVTRAVDPDGGGVQNMTLFCFDSYGLFISTATATLAPTSDLTGSFDAQVPDNTRTIHFLANQNMSEFKEDDFRGKSEAEVMSVLEGSSGRMIYWARFACDGGDEADIKTQITAKGNKIEMIRNQAQVSIADWETASFIVTGFTVINSNAFGTVAPYHPDKGYDFVWPDEADFVTLPLNDAKMSDITDVSTSKSEYIFECKNTSDDPVSVIIRGHLPDETEANDLYYRALLLDGKGEQLLIKRNFHYILNIKGVLSYGQKTFEAATTAPATNNVWISISDEVKSVEDNSYILTVDKTSYILDEEYVGNTYTLTYSLKGKDGTTVTEADEPTISWLDGNRVAGPSIGHSFTVTNGTGEGEIRISLLPLGNNEKLEGTLLVKKGKLQRTIKVITIKKQEFIPAWVGTQVYGSVNGSDKDSRAHVTVMFTIPETCPEELFPLRVLVSTNELDVRSAAGIALPVINDGDEGYGEPNGIGYKYVYIADAPGVQRIYFENVLNHSDTDEGTVKIEAEHFTTVNKTFKYSANQYSITVEGLNEYNAQNPSEENFPEDEVIYYRLVPQKRYAYVQFDMVMKDIATGDGFNAGNKDEFLLYSQNLDYYTDDEEKPEGVTAFDCTFYDVNETYWGNVGRMLMFMPRVTPTDAGHYSIYMKTNRAVSAEVVRISSNQSTSKPILSQNAGTDGNYGGNSYRSVTFELANYNPFRFAARVNNVGSDMSGTTPEETTALSWTYAPEQKVDIALDVTSFAGTDGKSADPFGEAFEIYIDAPMLEIDEARLAACNLNSTKLKADPNVEGRFIYTVDADRETERGYGNNYVINKDNTNGVNQAGERKTLPFKTSSIVSAGDIVISSNKEKVVFFDKTFTVSNTPISGTLKYAGADVPRNAFVSFERTRNGSRIGSVTVTADGRYELRLRKEYTFNWYTDEVEFHYEATDGRMYHKTYTNLAALFALPDVVLELAEEGN